MDLILHYLTIRLRQAFSPMQNTWGFIGLLGFMLLGLFYGAVTATLLDGTFMEITDEVAASIQRAVLFLIAGITFIRGYYPSYRPLQTWFKPFHALSAWQRFLPNYTNDLAATYFFTMACFIITATSLSDALSYTYGLQAGYVLLGTHVLRRLLQTVVEHKLHFSKTARILLVLSLVVLATAVAFMIWQPAHALVLSTIAFVALLVFGFTLEELTQREALQVHGTGKAGRSYTLDLLLKNRSVRVSLLMAMVVKTLFLALDVFYFAAKGTHMFANFAMMWLLASPAIVFTYVFNNTWGYLRHFWLLADRATADSKELLILLWHLAKRPMLLDFVLSLIYFSVIQDQLFIPGIAMYVTCAFLFTSMSLYWSSAYPIYIDKPVSMKANTSALASFTLLLLSMSFLLLFVSPWFYLLIPFYAVSGYWLLQQTLKQYPQQRQKLFLKLYKQ